MLIDKQIVDNALNAVKAMNNLGFDFANEALTAILQHDDYADRWEIETKYAETLAEYRECSLANDKKTISRAGLRTYLISFNYKLARLNSPFRLRSEKRYNYVALEVTDKKGENSSTIATGTSRHCFDCACRFVIEQI